MRMLFTCVPAEGHFNRVAPVASAAARSGHEVAVACADRFAPRLAARGLRHLPAGAPAFPETGVTDVAKRHEWLNREVLPYLTNTMFPDLVDAVTVFSPDLVVHGFAEQAASGLGLPHVTIAECSTHALAETYVDTLAAKDLRPADALAPCDPLAHLCFHPPEFHGPDAAFAPGAVFVEHRNERIGKAEDLDRLLAPLDPDLPLAVVSLGTIVSDVYPDAVAKLTDLLCDDRLRVVVLIGGPAAEVHEVAENRLIVVNGPQEALLREADVAVSSGGFMSVTEAMAEGAPQVIGPIQLDGYYAADRCEALGVAAVVNLPAAESGTVRAAVHSVLESPEYGHAARELAAQNARLPSTSEALRRCVESRHQVLGWASRSRSASGGSRPSSS